MCADKTRADTPRAIPLYLMAKAPLAGAVKTRLLPKLNAEQAASLACLMLEQTVHTACRHWPGEVILCVSPDPDHALFRRLIGKHRIKITTQIEADLGARMMDALTHGIVHAGGAAVMGCDVPHCSGEILARAHALLAGGENPLGPAQDGGFYLIGLQRDDAIRAFDSLFSGVHWSGSAVLAQVRARAATAALGFCQLPTLRDIDQYADVEWLAEIDDAYKRFVR